MDFLAKYRVRQTIRFDNQEIMITDIHRGLFEIEDLHNSLADISMGILRGRLHNSRSYESESDEEVSAMLLEELKEKAQQWGVVDFLQFNIIDCAPTSETAQVIIAKAGVMMKAEPEGLFSKLFSE